MDSGKYKVCVMMSTYNGELYIREQIDSILWQKNVNVLLYIRDDGSNDKTIDIVKEYITRNPEGIMLVSGENIGFAESFMQLVMWAPDADFYCFSDQDDIWEKDKLYQAVIRIDKPVPMLYGSNLKAFDAGEKREFFIYRNEDKEKAMRQMEKYIFISNPYGCTMVWNRHLQDELRKRIKPAALTHDVWVNLVARCTGGVYFDYDSSYINYRVHGNNACGVTPKSFLGKIKKYYKFYFSGKKSLNISCACRAIDCMFPDFGTEITKNLGTYDQSPGHFFTACWTVIHMDVPGSFMFKYIALMCFHKF